VKGECDLEVIGVPSTFKLIRRDEVLLQKSGQFPDESAIIKGKQIHSHSVGFQRY
jgi:hypothetical protein